MKSFLTSIVIACLFPGFFQLYGQVAPVSWQGKIHGKVFEILDIDSKVEVIIELTEQADLSGAKTLGSKDEKAHYVYQTLFETAKNQQSQIIQYLNKNDIDHKAFHIVNAIYAYIDIEQLEYLARMEEVEKIQFNVPFKKQKTIRNTAETSRDPNVVEWGIEKINADDVWDMGISGTGVVIGGQDTGYDWDHEALINKYRGWTGGTSADHNYNWHDAIHEINENNTGDNPCGLDSPEPCDDHGHGTHTMGTMVGSFGTIEIGVAPDAQWIGCRNMERGDGTPETYLECFEWFLAPTDLNDENPDPTKAPHVINNSWSCPTSEGCDGSYDFGIMETAITNLQSSGVVVVVSAGNEGSSCETIETPPAFYPSTFSVGATNSSDVIASFSSRGPTSGYGAGVLKPDVCAPGVAVYSSKPDDDYGTSNGTSMAGPHVAGTVALLIDAVPELEGDVDAIHNILEITSVPLTTTQNCGGVDGDEIPNNTYGYGRIDALAAVNHAINNLALELLSFEGIAEEGFNHLFWETADHETETHFVLEKSMNQWDWVSVANISIDNKMHYTFRDIHPFPGVNYYRLKTFDLDGSFTVSKIISVSSRIKLITDLYPNPITKGKLNLLFEKEMSNLQFISIHSVDGLKLYHYDLSQSERIKHIDLEIPELPAGVYFLSLFDQDGLPVERLRFLKQ